MATVPKKVEYPTGDGKPMAETDVHRDLLLDLVKTLQVHFAGDPMTYVSGNLLLFYEEGNRRKHVSPDVFVVRGIPKHDRLHYLMWAEGKGPDFVIELTSKTTRREDRETKLALYRDVLHVAEYFLFDPLGDYLRPSLQGHRLIDGSYAPIEPDAGRLTSLVTGLHLEADGRRLRLFDPVIGLHLPSLLERAGAAEARAGAAEARAGAAEARARSETDARRVAEGEIERLRREIEELRRSSPGGSPISDA